MDTFFIIFMVSVSYSCTNNISAETVTSGDSSYGSLVAVHSQGLLSAAVTVRGPTHNFDHHGHKAPPRTLPITDTTHSDLTHGFAPPTTTHHMGATLDEPLSAMEDGSATPAAAAPTTKPSADELLTSPPGALRLKSEYSQGCGYFHVNQACAWICPSLPPCVLRCKRRGLLTSMMGAMRRPRGRGHQEPGPPPTEGGEDTALNPVAGIWGLGRLRPAGR